MFDIRATHATPPGCSRTTLRGEPIAAHGLAFVRGMLSTLAAIGAVVAFGLTCAGLAAWL